MKQTTFLILITFFSIQLRAEKPVVRIGSKTFTENYILAELIAQIFEEVGEAQVERSFGLGGTGITFSALKEGEIDAYVDYTGTIREAILKNPLLATDEQLAEAVEKKYNIELSPSLGFNNTYVFALSKEGAKKYKIKKVSELKELSDLKTVFTHEFIKRGDGLRALERHYGFTFKHPLSMEHSLAFEALRKGKVDLMEVYSTDAKIRRYELHLLEDDQKFFPDYRAVMLMRKDFKERFPRTYEALKEKVFGQLDEGTMIKLNSLVELDGYSFRQAAAVFLGKENLSNTGIPLKKIMKLTGEHLQLVFVALFFSILLGVPVGILATRNRFLAQFSLIGSGLLQTIPSLALLCFLIPFFGIGTTPAYMALFLYGLLPIVRNTYTGISQIDPTLVEAADLMGLTKREKLRLVQLPLASVNIMTGIKTSAIINVGTATLAAFIGAGGLGSLIVTGLSLNNNKVILTGAIPAALLASLIHLLFEVFDRVFVPKGITR
jgi:osmoprotectant transport system permease protein